MTFPPGLARALLVEIGEDPEREGLQAPERLTVGIAAKMSTSVYRGVFQNDPDMRAMLGARH